MAVKPIQGEGRLDFDARAMADEEMLKTFPNPDHRYAESRQIWEKNKSDSLSDRMKALGDIEAEVPARTEEQDKKVEELVKEVGELVREVGKVKTTEPTKTEEPAKVEETKTEEPTKEDTGNPHNVSQEQVSDSSTVEIPGKEAKPTKEEVPAKVEEVPKTE